MARTVRKLPTALWAMTAAVAATVIAASPASARPAAVAGPAQTPVPATCQASDLAITVPVAVSGDPDQGMGKRAWNILFRNTARASCSVQGWPRLAVRNAAGRAVATTVSNVKYSNLAAIPDSRITLSPGGTAVVTAMSATAPAGCVMKWTLGLALPGAAQPVTVREPSGSFVPCVGGQLQLSPFYSQQTLTSDIKALSASSAAPFSVAATAMPATCAAAALQAAVSSVTSSADGSTIELRLSNSGPACALPESWPTVNLKMAGGGSQVAKIFPDSAATKAGQALIKTYRQGNTQTTALSLDHGAAVSIALFAASSGSPTCQQVVALTVYPTTAASGAGRTATLAKPVRICGAPRVLSFVPSGSTSQVTALAKGALSAAKKPSTAADASAAASNGFYYGTDSAAPTACGNGSGPYQEPRGSCANGTAGVYGEYIGEVGTFMQWKGCTTAGLAWDQANYNMATANVVKFSAGLGAAAYWFAGGPGRDPHYNGTAAEAYTWGRQQAQAALGAMSGKIFNFRYVFFDVENNGVAPDPDGWNTVWNGPCGGTVRASYIPENIDFAVWQGFAEYINNHSSYLPGVYSAAGSSYGAWAGIFGNLTLTGAAEWTFDNEQAQLDFPSGFTGSHANALWFAGAPAACHLLWQWSGGDGVLNGYGDFDTANAANDANPACAAPKPSTSTTTSTSSSAPPSSSSQLVAIHHH